MPVASGLVSQSAISQTPSGLSQKPATPVAINVHQHSITGSNAIPVLQPARPASQLTATQAVTGTIDKSLSSSSTASPDPPVSRLLTLDRKPTSLPLSILRKRVKCLTRKLVYQNRTLITTYLKSKTTKKPLEK